MTGKFRFLSKPVLLFVGILLFSGKIFQAGQEIVDRILAVVEDEVITLTDVRIVEEFELFSESLPNGEERRKIILEKLIDQKLVLRMAEEEFYVRGEEVDAFLRRLAQKMGYETVNRKLESFGLAWDDLRKYIREEIAFQEIIAQKFKKSVVISLKEIESYYTKVYLSLQKGKNEPILPMMEILDVIESVLRDEKTKEQVREWISSLREKAEIQVNDFKSF
ncbi:MAG: hypothetical protein JXB26_01090 [Candidatus Aminicenantes bacterium]|nr:hypothetical protein [Candidatus Aminicenantes bacterium]